MSGAVALACGVGIGVLPASGAAAAVAHAGDDGGLWYLTRTGVEAAHARTQGAGVTVGIVDGVVDPAAGDLAGADVTVHEPASCTAPDGAWARAASTAPAARHATGMASLVVGTGAGAGVRGVAPRAHVVVYSVLTSAADGSARLASTCPRPAGDPRGWLEPAIDAAVADHVDVLSISMTVDELDARDAAAVARARRAGVLVVAAGAHAGPSAHVPVYPASLPGVLSVESSGPDGRVAEEASVDATGTVVAPGQDVRQPGPDLASPTTESGSSTATAWTAGVAALVWSAYPGATANQVLQDLVRTTGGTEHDVRGDGVWGLGAVDLTAALAHDPRSYPDVDPLPGRGAHGGPAGTVAPAGAGATIGAPRATVGAPRSTDTWPRVGAGLGVALLLAGVVTVVVRRRTRAPGVSASRR